MDAAGVNGKAVTGLPAPSYRMHVSEGKRMGRRGSCIAGHLTPFVFTAKTCLIVTTAIVGSDEIHHHRAAGQGNRGAAY